MVRPPRAARRRCDADVRILLDLSRLAYGVHRATPSGIDRVELAYAQHFLTRPGGVTALVQSLWGWFAAIPQERAVGLTGAVAAAWNGEAGSLATARRIAAAIHGRLALGRGRLPRTLDRAAFLLVSHRALDRAAPIAALTARGAAFVPFVHDLIPLTHPEYARPAQTGRHAVRVANVARHASAVIVNSAATAATLAPYLAPPAGPNRPAVLVAPLGITVAAASRAPTTPARFLCVGTIEPRKNHLLLLHLWREFAATLGDAAPRLVLIGRRGWENENILDLLERGAGLRGLVEEAGAVDDAAIVRQMAGATALLFPSFVEGYGLPLAEALAAGLPAICSDIPALREIGGDVPDYLHPLDGLGWRRAILDHAQPDSALRRRQEERRARWRLPGWAAHFAAVERLLETLPEPAR